MPKLKEPDPNPGVTINVLVCLGELAQVSGIAMRDYTPELLPLIIDMLQDSSSIQKREVGMVRKRRWRESGREREEREGERVVGCNYVA